MTAYSTQIDIAADDGILSTATQSAESTRQDSPLPLMDNSVTSGPRRAQQN
jgi:hypothetical protein